MRSKGTPQSSMITEETIVKPPKWQCPVCSKVLSSKRSFVEHSNVHSDRRPYECTDCSYAAASHMTLRRHMLRRHASKHTWGYACPYCYVPFIEPAAYQNHVKSNHVGRSATYGCVLDECPFRTMSVRHLESHMARHVIYDEETNEMVNLVEAQGDLIDASRGRNIVQHRVFTNNRLTCSLAGSSRHEASTSTTTSTAQDRVEHYHNLLVDDEFGVGHNSLPNFDVSKSFPSSVVVPRKPAAGGRPPHSSVCSNGTNVASLKHETPGAKRPRPKIVVVASSDGNGNLWPKQFRSTNLLAPIDSTFQLPPRPTIGASSTNHARPMRYRKQVHIADTDEHETPPRSMVDTKPSSLMVFDDEDDESMFLSENVALEVTVETNDEHGQGLLDGGTNTGFLDHELD